MTGLGREGGVARTEIMNNHGNNKSYQIKCALVTQQRPDIIFECFIMHFEGSHIIYSHVVLPGQWTAVALILTLTQSYIN